MLTWILPVLFVMETPQGQVRDLRVFEFATLQSCRAYVRWWNDHPDDQLETMDEGFRVAEGQTLRCERAPAPIA